MNLVALVIAEGIQYYSLLGYIYFEAVVNAVLIYVKNAG
jgi:hypothetical protein